MEWETSIHMSFTALLMATPQQTISQGVPSPCLPGPRGPLWWHTPMELNGNTAHQDTRWDWTDPETNLHHAPNKKSSQWRQKEEDPLAGCLKGACQEAFRKDTNLVKWIRQTFFRAHCLEFDSEITHNLAHVFKEMADIVGLLNTEIHQVQDLLPGRKELCGSQSYSFWVLPRTFVISRWCHSQNPQRSWAWRGYIPQRP